MIFISGNTDWGMHQKPGDLECMQEKFFENNYGTFIIKDAGHWVQQEQPQKTSATILKFYKELL